MKMTDTKVVGFTYTKDNGEVSERKCITLGYSSPLLGLMADVTDCSNAEIKGLKSELGRLRTEYLMDIQDTLEAYAVQQKTFKLANVTDEKEIAL